MGQLSLKVRDSELYATADLNASRRTDAAVPIAEIGTRYIGVKEAAKRVKVEDVERVAAKLG